MRKLNFVLAGGLILLCCCSAMVVGRQAPACVKSGCEMDSSITGFELLIPNLPDSIALLQVGGIGGHVVDDFQNGEGVYISNKSGTEFAFLKVNNGGMGRQFDAFILTDTMPSGLSTSVLRSGAERFTTSHGAYIGMSKSDFIKTCLNADEPKTDIGSKYERFDSYSLLYNKYHFSNDTLRKIEIGYEW